MMSRACVVKLIETTTTKGKGTKDDPMREVKEWWTFNGEYVTGHDYFHLGQLAEISGVLCFKGVDTGSWIEECAKEIANKVISHPIHVDDEEVIRSTIRDHLGRLFKRLAHS